MSDFWYNSLAQSIGDIKDDNDGGSDHIVVNNELRETEDGDIDEADEDAMYSVLFPLKTDELNSESLLQKYNINNCDEIADVTSGSIDISLFSIDTIEDNITYMTLPNNGVTENIYVETNAKESVVETKISAEITIENSGRSTGTSSGNSINIISSIINSVQNDAVYIADSVLKKASQQASNAAAVTHTFTTNVGTKIASNPVVATITSIASESLAFTVDRATHGINHYIKPIVTADDPETSHLKRIRDAEMVSNEWNTERLCMASLSWSQRQLIQETRCEMSIEKLCNGALSGGGIELPVIKKATEADPAVHVEFSDVDRSHSIKITHETEPTLKLWLANAAAAGDEEAQYALSKWFCPPAFHESTCCYICHKVFNPLLFRHHCRHCGRSVCGDDSPSKQRILRFGMTTPMRVCTPCATILRDEVRRDNLTWKKLRIQAYLANKLLPYVHLGIDRGVDKVSRLVDGTLKVIRNTLSLNYPAMIIIETVKILKTYGLSGLTGLLMRKDFMEAVETLKKISGLDKIFTMSLHELTACIYYKLAIDRGIRGCQPLLESQLHNDHVDDVTDAELDEVIRFAPLALKLAYEADSVECQRLAKLQHWDPIYISTESNTEQPAYMLLATSRSYTHKDSKKEAVLVIRGTKSIHDVVTDIRAAPQHFPPSSEEVSIALTTGFSVYDKNITTEELIAVSTDESNKNEFSHYEWLKVYADSETTYACGGMARGAYWLITQVGQSLLALYKEGYDIRIVGHSLGGAVGAMATYLLKDYITNIKCLAFASPSCVDSTIADELRDRVTSVVLHDDVICRLTPQSIRALMKELIVFREQVFHHLQQDWRDSIKRAMSLWSPRVRGVPLNTNDNLMSPTSPTDAASAASISSSLAEALVIVDEEKIADLYIPGRILHIYSYKGQYKLCYVDKKFSTLRKIELQGIHTLTYLLTHSLTHLLTYSLTHLLTHAR